MSIEPAHVNLGYDNGMPKVLIVGDSQAQGTPGQYAESKFRDAGFSTRRIANHSKGAIDYTTDTALWAQYTDALRTFRPDVVVLIFGSNDSGARLDDALIRMKNVTAVPVWISGPPLYPVATRQQLGESIRATNQQVFGTRWIDAYPFTPLSLPRDSLQAHLPGQAGRPWGEAIAAAVLRASDTLGPPAGPPVAPIAAALAVGAGMVALAAAVVLVARRRRPVSRNQRRR